MSLNKQNAQVVGTFFVYCVFIRVSMSKLRNTQASPHTETAHRGAWNVGEVICYAPILII